MSSQLDRQDHRLLAEWAADCAERVLPVFEAAHRQGDRPRQAIAAGRAWERGELRFPEMIDPLHDKPFDAPARAEGSSGAVTSRCYETDHDLWQMQNLLMQARLETDDWRYAHVGDLLFQLLMVAYHLNPREHIHLWHAAGKLVGYAVLGEDPA